MMAPIPWTFQGLLLPPHTFTTQSNRMLVVSIKSLIRSSPTLQGLCADLVACPGHDKVAVGSPCMCGKSAAAEGKFCNLDVGPGTPCPVSTILG